MTSINHEFDLSPWPDLCIPLSAAVVGLIPGLGYLALFLCGVLGVVDWVGLLADHFPAWVAPLVIGGLIFSTIVGATSGSEGRCRPGLRACRVVAILLLAVDVPIIVVQLITFFACID
jgi:hypothetical protein